MKKFDKIYVCYDCDVIFNLMEDEKSMRKYIKKHIKEGHNVRAIAK